MPFVSIAERATTCKQCGDTIAKGELRVNVSTGQGRYTKTVRLHPRCLGFTRAQLKQLDEELAQRGAAAKVRANHKRKEAEAQAFLNDDDEYEVERLLDSRVKHGRTEYRVLWKGYELKDATWEPGSNLPVELVSEFVAPVYNGMGGH